jgi:hypothetical protein
MGNKTHTLTFLSPNGKTHEEDRLETKNKWEAFVAKEYPCLKDVVVTVEDDPETAGLFLVTVESSAKYEFIPVETKEEGVLEYKIKVI